MLAIVREGKDGHWFYDHGVVSDEGPAGPNARTGPPSNGGGRTPGGGASADHLIQSDPQLKALADATAQFAAEHGVAEGPDADGARDPDQLVKGMRAAAQCLIDAADEVIE